MGMYLLKTVGSGARGSMSGASECFGNRSAAGEVPAVSGLAAWLLEMARRWKRRGHSERRRKARKQMYLVESLVLGPKQRLVLLRCGREQFLVGTGPEGIQTIVPVGAGRELLPSHGKSAGESQWG